MSDLGSVETFDVLRALGLRLSAEDARRVFLEPLKPRGDLPERQIRQAGRAGELFPKALSTSYAPSVYNGDKSPAP